MADLLSAIGTLATKLIPNSTGDKRIAYALRLNEYAGRYASSVVPVAPADDEPLSSNANVAEMQILTSLGFDIKQAIVPEAVLKVASPDQNRELALLGFFGHPGDHPGADYSLFERYYQEAPVGLDVNGQPTEGNWAPKDPTTSPWQAWQAGA